MALKYVKIETIVCVIFEGDAIGGDLFNSLYRIRGKIVPVLA
jgi:hypothetical protein